MGFLELEQELPLNLPTHVLLGKAGARGPRSRQPPRSLLPPHSLPQGERGSLRSD